MLEGKLPLSEISINTSILALTSLHIDVNSRHRDPFYPNIGVHKTIIVLLRALFCLTFIDTWGTLTSFLKKHSV